MLNGDEKAGAEYAQVAWDLFKASTEGSLAYRLGHNQGISSLTILALKRSQATGSWSTTSPEALAC